ncbi:MAG: hypothetical protein HUJ29_03130 [Gammaproteobacteria bacterium]|nr:hypothetical protein [Gammaproteobacteria bacterium]
MDLHLSLTLLSGICWTLVYIDGIRIGLRDHSYAIPFWALALNLAWEIQYAVLGYQSYGLRAQTGINLLWFLLDLGILYTFIRYGKKYFPTTLQPGKFYAWIFLGIVSAIVIQWLFYHEFGLIPGAKYSAFLQNLLMSILFVSMLVQRGSAEGQSQFIAINKWIGTLAATLHLGLLDEGPGTFILVTGVLIMIFDVLYIVLLQRVSSARSEKS